MAFHTKVFAPHWGSADLAPQVFIDRTKAAGFDGIEMSLPQDAVERDGWVLRIADAGLCLIVHQWETVLHSDFAAHKEALRATITNACAARPLKINSQTGKDFYSQAQNLELLALGQAIANEHDIPLYHEIHRSRFSGHPMLLWPYLDAMPDLRLTADLSHWCCACETLLQDQPDTLERVLPLVGHVHARVGHAQGPQVSDFRAPEFAAELAAHLGWWDRIVDLQRAAGAAFATFTPEFGPVPYTPTAPYTQAPLADAWALNVAMLELLRDRYATEPTQN